jgi:hypothetical protein
MDLIRKMIPSRFVPAITIYVAVCWKQKVHGKKIMMTRSTPRVDEATLKVKNNL